MIKTLLLIALTICSVSAQEGFLQNLEQSNNIDFKLFFANFRNNTNVTTYLEAFDGFATGVGIYQEMPAFEACKFRDASIVDDVVVFIEDIVHKQYDTIIDDLKDFIDNLYGIYKNCDFKGFENQFIQMLNDVKTNFTQPEYLKKFLANLQSNIFQIMADLKLVVDNYNSKNFEEFGKGLGSLTRTVFLVKQQ